MKHQNLLKSFLLALIAAILPLLASAYDFMVDGIAYNYNGDYSVAVTYIERYSNENYSNLETAIIPSNVIGRFGNTYSVTSIEEDAFYGCSGLTSVTIPNSVTEIGLWAFYGCSGLTSVTIPNSVTTIGHDYHYGSAFTGCSGLTSVIVESDNSKYDSRDNCNAIIESETNTLIVGCKNSIIPNSVTKIGEHAFSGCTGLTSITIPDSVTVIGDGAFNDCTGLTSIAIPNSVTSIGDNAFNGCSGLASVTIPNSVTSIGIGAFYGCSGLTSVTIPNSVTSIGSNAFSGCSGLTSVIVESDNSKYDSRDNCNAIIESETNTLIVGCKNSIIPNSVTKIGDYVFYRCTGLASATIPNSVTSIGLGAFCGCSGLTSLTIPNSVTSIGVAAFNGCSGLTSVTIPNSVTNIGASAFSACTGLTSITLTGQGVWYSKSDMPSISQLKTVNIGSGITSLGDFDFTPDVVNCYAETPPSCSSATFANYNGELHVPTTSIAAYFTADYWQNFNNLVNDLTDKVTLDKTNANLIIGDTLALAATVVPEEREILWGSNNPSVATVDKYGVVTATGEGECDIFATLASNPAVYAWCHIVSSYPEITLSLSEESLDMNLGDEYELIATITPDNIGLIPSWTSSDESVAIVENGVVTAVGEGECDITATVLDKIANCHVTVSGDVTIMLNIGNAILGASQMLTVYPSCSPDVPVELVVTSSDPSVALARVVNRTNAPALGLKSFPEKGMALALMEEVAAPSESKDPALASTKAIMIVGVQNGTATITVTTADGKAEPAVLELRVVDVDGDSTITASDITCLYNYLLNSDESYIDTSDTDGDGFITSADITVLYNLMLGN